MADMTMSGAGVSCLAFYVPRLGFGLAVIALLMLALAPIGWRTGMWHFRTSFWYLMQPAASNSLRPSVRERHDRAKPPRRQYRPGALG